MAKRRTRKQKQKTRAKRKTVSKTVNRKEKDLAATSVGRPKYVFDETILDGEEVSESDSSPGMGESLLSYDAKLLKKDLRKTILLSLGVMAAILAFWRFVA